MKKTFDSNTDYHSSNAISASGLKTIADKSVYDYLHKENIETDAMRRGTAIHEAILEPDLFQKNYYKMPKIDGRTKAGKEEKAKHIDLANGKIVLDEVDYNTILKIAERVATHKLASNYTHGIVEQSHYFDYKGISCRCRPDCFDPIEGWISDVKSIREITSDSIKKDIKYRFYDLQAYAYCTWLNVNPKRFRFIFVETKKPFKVELVGLSDEQIKRGKYYFEDSLKRWKYYLETGIAEQIEPMEYAEDGAKIF